jgi:hypothetical protein
MAGKIGPKLEIGVHDGGAHSRFTASRQNGLSHLPILSHLGLSL